MYLVTKYNRRGKKVAEFKSGSLTACKWYSLNVKRNSCIVVTDSETGELFFEVVRGKKDFPEVTYEKP